MRDGQVRGGIGGNPDLSPKPQSCLLPFPLLCCYFLQVVLMLKSSDRIGHDLDHLQTRQQQQQGAPLSPPLCLLPAVLVLRKWNPSLRPEREFRCFVRAGTLAGACQRDITQHFPQLAAPSAAVATEETAGAGEDGEGPTAGDDGGSGTGDGGGSTPLQAIKRAIAGFHRDHVATSAFPLQHCEAAPGCGACEGVKLPLSVGRLRLEGCDACPPSLLNPLCLSPGHVYVTRAQ